MRKLVIRIVVCLLVCCTLFYWRCATYKKKLEVYQQLKLCDLSVLEKRGFISINEREITPENFSMWISDNLKRMYYISEKDDSFDLYCNDLLVHSFRGKMKIMRISEAPNEFGVIVQQDTFVSVYQKNNLLYKCKLDEGEIVRWCDFSECINRFVLITRKRSGVDQLIVDGELWGEYREITKIYFSEDEKHLLAVYKGPDGKELLVDNKIIHVYSNKEFKLLDAMNFRGIEVLFFDIESIDMVIYPIITEDMQLEVRIKRCDSLTTEEQFETIATASFEDVNRWNLRFLLSNDKNKCLISLLNRFYYWSDQDLWKMVEKKGSIYTASFTEDSTQFYIKGIQDDFEYIFFPEACKEITEDFEDEPYMGTFGTSMKIIDVTAIDEDRYAYVYVDRKYRGLYRWKRFRSNGDVYRAHNMREDYYVKMQDDCYGPYDYVTPVVYSSDLTHFAFMARKDNKYFSVVDGKRGESYDYPGIFLKKYVERFQGFRKFENETHFFDDKNQFHFLAMKENTVYHVIRTLNSDKKE